MVDFEAYKNNLIKNLYKELQAKYLLALEEANNVNQAFQEIFKETSSEYIKAQAAYVKSKNGKVIIPINNLIQDIDNLLALKKKETYNTAFTFFTKGFNETEQKKLIEKVAISETYKNQIDFLIEEEIKLFPQNLLKNEVSEKINTTSVEYFPSIFKNFDSYQMFLELKSLTVKEKTIVADYSYIFHHMKDKSLKAINLNVSEPIFINFLNTNFEANIDSRKLPYRNPDNKKKIFSTVLDKYKDQIKIEPKKVQ